jgi:hypothetical protein
MPWLKQRTIRLADGLEGEITAAKKRFPRFDEAWEGIAWLLARNPTPVDAIQTTYGGKPYCLLGCSGDPAATTADMWLVYEYDDDVVVIHGLNLVEPSPEPEE